MRATVCKTAGMSAPKSPPAATASLQRRPEARQEPGWIDAALGAAGTRFLVSCGTTHLIRREPRAQIAFLPPEHALVAAAQRSQLLLLGWFHGQRCVLVDLPPDPPPAVAGAHFEELRSVIALLPEAEAQLLVYARALIVWRSRHRHCGVCGAPTEARSAGHVLACTR
ncbi:MAG: NUDIX-like domain-containing protein, partial [Steroidobacteraceae bacterium]